MHGRAGHSRCATARVVLAAAACMLSLPTPRAQGQAEFVPVTDAMLRAPDPGDWPMWRRTLDGWGYSPLDQIDRGNVGDLRLEWSRALRRGGRQQGTPLVYDGVLYMPNPSDVIQAIDAATGDLLWEYQRPLPDDACERILPGVCTTNRNLAIYDDLIIDTSVDEFVFALDAQTGELVWRHRSSITGRIRRTRAPARSSPTARSSPGGAACPRPDRTPASSPRTTRGRARSCGGGEPSRGRESRATRRGAACPTSSAATSGRGWRRASTPS